MMRHFGIAQWEIAYYNDEISQAQPAPTYSGNLRNDD
jgi:hypothetical protein